MKIIQHKNKKYKFFASDIFQLIEYVEKNNYKKSFDDLMKSHRHSKSKIEDLIIENNRDEENKCKTIYFVIFDKHNVISSARVGYKKETSHLSFVCTSSKYRRMGFCHKMITLIIKLLSDTTKLKEITLGVLISNTSAINCYLKSGFSIIGNYDAENYKMVYQL